MEIPRHWRLKGQRYNLEGLQCENKHPVFPPRPICTECHGMTPIHPNYKKGLLYETKQANSSLKTEEISKS